MDRNFYFILGLLFLVSSSCSKDDTGTAALGDPENLSLEVTVAQDGTGVVQVAAQAENAVEYQIDMAENSSTPPTTNTSGSLEYTYSNSGIYDIEVKAFGTSGRFIRKTKQITVQLGNDDVAYYAADGYVTPINYPDYALSWQDEFSGSSLNTSNWTHEIGNGCPNLCGWGNNELQYYRSENTSLEDGKLTIEARKEDFQNNGYTSSRMITKNKFSFKYGRVDIRAILPKGKGLWPALWMLGDNISSVGWPSCGETDIMELVGHIPEATHGTIHYDNNGDYASTGGSKYLDSETFSDAYHVFSIVWNTESITWYVNDEMFYNVSITSSNLSEFHQNFFLIFNVAVGGNWPGNPNSSTVFPQQMKVDYIRVFQ